MAKKIGIKDQFLSIVQKFRGGSKKYVINNVTVRPPNRQTQDIQNWRNAIKHAEGYAQQRSKLFDLYEDMLLDGHLQAVLAKRVEQVTNRRLVFVRKDGKTVDDITELADKSFFEEFLVEAMNAKFWGNSLMELFWPAPGSDEIGETKLIPRKNVKPRWGIVTENEFDLEGIDYRGKDFGGRVIEIGKPESLGLLMSVAQYVIYKRGNFGDWAEYAEIFGIPFRWASYNNETSRAVLETALEAAGPAGYVVAPQDADLKFMNGNPSGNGQMVFSALREACNEEISIAVLGNTMTTTEAKSSGYAQSQTHQEGENEKNRSDRRFILRLLNEKLTPYLKAIGYATDGGKWEFQEDDHLSLSERIAIDMQVASKVPIADSYWYNTYGVDKPDPSELREQEDEDEDEPDDENDDPTDDPPGGEDPDGDQDPPRELKLNTPGPDDVEDDPDDSDGPDDVPIVSDDIIGFNDDPDDTEIVVDDITGLSEKKKVSQPDKILAFYDIHGNGCECGRCLQMADLPPVRFRKIPNKVQRQVANRVYQGDFQIDADLHRHYYQRFREYARLGFARSLSDPDDWDDYVLQEGIKRNISEFAAVKSKALIEELRPLISKNRQEYDKAAARIIKRYNTVYLQAELVTLETAAHTAGQWADFMDRADLYPNLKYSTVGDDRVRPAHAALDGAVYPVNDPFWDTHTPPLGWRCRCILIQTDDEAVQRPAQEVRKGFGRNPYKEKALIHRNHPYFDMPAAQLTELLEYAEVLRAAIERQGVRQAADKYVGQQMPIDIGTATITAEDLGQILSSDSRQMAVRNSLLAVLSLVLREMNKTGYVSGSLDPIYEVSLLGEVFQLFFEQEGDAWKLVKVTAR